MCDKCFRANKALNFLLLLPNVLSDVVQVTSLLTFTDFKALWRKFQIDHFDGEHQITLKKN